METKQEKVNDKGVQDQRKDNKPNENGVISVQGHLRIFDPNTDKTLVEGRA